MTSLTTRPVLQNLTHTTLFPQSRSRHLTNKSADLFQRRPRRFSDAEQSFLCQNFQASCGIIGFSGCPQIRLTIRIERILQDETRFDTLHTRRTWLHSVCRPGLAHAQLKETTPADQNTLSSSPTTLSLGFTEGLNLAFSGVDVVNTSGTDVPHDKPTLAEGDDTTLRIALSSPLAPDVYTVKWHVLSVDGHESEGSYSLTVKR